MFKDTISEATRHNAVYGHDPVTDRPVSIAPAETEVTPAEQAARDAYRTELGSRANAVSDPEISRAMMDRAPNSAEPGFGNDLTDH